MPTGIGILPMRNRIQPYAWGSRTAIATLLGRPVPAHEPQAELWMGAHSQGPSEVWIADRWEPLPELIRRHPQGILGPEAAARFAGTLPFLFKVLAAERPLSIQAHPDARRAREGFAREEAAGIPLDDPRRTYRDPNPKPEVLSALQTFQALAGFRPIPAILELLEQTSLDSLRPAVERLRRRPDPAGLRELFRALVTLPPEGRSRAVAEAVRWAQDGAGSGGGEELPWIRAWVLRLAGEYPRDPGVLAPLLLNLVRLEPGETIYLPPGVPHAYLEGLGVELMANSDNVLRGGLTAKHIDVPRLIEILDFRAFQPRRIDPQPLPSGAVAWPAPAPQFLLSRLAVREDRPYLSPPEHGLEILLAVEGQARVLNPAAGQRERGGSLLVPASAGPYRIEGRADIYRASIP